MQSINFTKPHDEEEPPSKNKLNSASYPPVSHKSGDGIFPELCSEEQKSEGNASAVPVAESALEASSRSYSFHSSFSSSREFEENVDEPKKHNQSFSKFRGLWCRLFSAISGQQGRSQRRRGNSWEIPPEHIRDLQFIRHGAQASVYRGVLYNEVVAVKEFREKLPKDFDLIRKLSHPNIIKFIGICKSSPFNRVVMEFCHWGSLYDIFIHEGIVLPHQVVCWAAQIADGMNYLHKHRVIHRDLKSANVLRTDVDSLKISDFGTCRRWCGSSKQMSCSGTYRWMSPEVIKSEPSSEKTDIWSFGVLLWELFTCEIPYKALEEAQVVFGVAYDKLQLPIPETLPECYKILLKQCWDRTPNNRPSFQRILKYLDDFKEVMNNIDVSDYLQAQEEWRLEINAEVRKGRNSSRWRQS